MIGSRERSFLDTLSPTCPAALVLGTGTSHALAIVRSLGRRGIPVVLAGTNRGPRLRSRYGRLERIFDSPSHLLTWLADMGPRLPCPAALLPTGDADVVFTTNHRVQLEPNYRFALPASDRLERLIDKKWQYAEVRNAGVSVPCTHAPRSQEELECVATTIGYPCVIKPARSEAWRSVHRHRALRNRRAKAALILSAMQLKEAFVRARADDLDVIVQELVPGDESNLFSLYTYCDRTSVPLGTFVLRKARQWPPDFGNGSYSVGCQDATVVAMGHAMLRHLQYRGMANVEFKRDVRDGLLKLIEINCRSGNRLGLAIDSGIDLPFIAYADLVGDQLPIEGPRDGLRWIDDARDLAAFRHYRRRHGLSLRDWLRSAWTAESHAFLSLDDPLPFASDLWHSTRSLWQRD